MVWFARCSDVCFLKCRPSEYLIEGVSFIFQTVMEGQNQEEEEVGELDEVCEEVDRRL